MVLSIKCVVFLDILGFRSKVQTAGRSAKATEKLDRALEVVHRVGREKLDGASVTVFSDSVVISVEPNADEVRQLISNLSEMIWNLMRKGIWMRGGLTVGKLSSNPSRPWGPAFIDAYDTETKLANFPRVVISRKAVEHL